MNAWRPDFAAGSRLFAPLAGAAAAFAAFPAWPVLADFDALAARLDLRSASGLLLRFVPPPPKPRRGRHRRPTGALPYNERILALGEVPTRLASWHDFFNVLAWATFPRAKAALNARQVASATDGEVRCHEQNRLAMLDEGGVVVCGTDRLVIGHALCEAAMLGQLDVHGMACVVPMNAGFAGASLAERVAHADSRLAAAVQAALFAGPTRFGTVPLRELL